MGGEVESSTAASQEQVAGVLGEGEADESCSAHANLLIIILISIGQNLKAEEEVTIKQGLLVREAVGSDIFDEGFSKLLKLYD